jgi:hypothetical protein
MIGRAGINRPVEPRNVVLEPPKRMRCSCVEAAKFSCSPVAELHLQLTADLQVLLPVTGFQRISWASWAVSCLAASEPLPPMNQLQIFVASAIVNHSYRVLCERIAGTSPSKSNHGQSLAIQTMATPCFWYGGVCRGCAGRNRLG